MSSVLWSTLIFSSELVSMFSSGVPWIFTSACIGSCIMSESLITSASSGPAAFCCYTSARISASSGSSRSASFSSSIHSPFAGHLQIRFDDLPCLPVSHPLQLQQIHPLLLHLFVLINLPLPFVISIDNGELITGLVVNLFALWSSSKFAE